MGHDRFEKRDEPQNLSEMGFIAISEFAVREWHPEKDGQGDPEMIVITMMIEGIEDFHLGLRLKTRRSVDDLIQMLTTHRDLVWPKE